MEENFEDEHRVEVDLTRGIRRLYNQSLHYRIISG